MKLFTITLMHPTEGIAEHLIQSMTERIACLHMAPDTVRFDLEFNGKHARITCRGILPAFQLGKSADEIYNKAAECIADLILFDQEHRLVEKMITQEFGYTDEEAAVAIKSYCRQMLDANRELPGPDRTATSRRTKLIDALTEYLQNHTELNIHGFLRFRSHDYLNELREAVEYAIDEFLMDKQYQEFISLLKYFVYIQEAKIPVAHLFHQGGNEFILMNDQLEPIDTADFDATFTVEMVEKDIHFEDMIVSTLITVSPQKIFIHTHEPEVQIINTIRQIFEHRAEVCSYCKLCKTYLSESKTECASVHTGKNS